MYTMSDIEQVRRQLDCLLGVWQGNNESRIEDCMNEKIYAAFSNFGKLFVRDMLLEAMKKTWKEHTEFSILQHDCLIAGKEAFQYATILGLIWRGPQHICFGGTFNNKLTLSEGRWVYTELRFELQEDNGIEDQYLTESGHIVTIPGKGDRSLMTGWKMVNDRVGYFMDPLKEQGQHMILGEWDAPWNRASEEADDKPEAVMLQNLFDRFCFAYDTTTLMIIRDFLSEDFILHSDSVGDLDKHHALGYLRIRRQGAPRSFLAGKARDIRIEESAAECDFICYSPAAFTGEWGEEGWIYGCRDRALHASFIRSDNTWKFKELRFR